MMKKLFLTALIGLWAEAVLAQGVFTYSFVGDTSRWNIYAQFQATEAAVGGGYLASSNTFGGLLSLDGQQVPLSKVNLWVDSRTGAAIAPASRYTVIAYVGLDEVDILGGTASCFYFDTRIAIYPWTGSAANDITEGHWIVNYAVPEPGALPLMLMGAWVLKKGARRRA